MSILATSGDAETEKMTILAASGDAETVLMSKNAGCEVREGVEGAASGPFTSCASRVFIREHVEHGCTLTPHHARYYALDLARRGLSGEVDAVGTALFDAQVDLNPHQIEAALAGFGATAECGRLLADEVGLGKTIEAALILCQRWAERRRHLLVIAPAALRKQWAQELEEKFGLPVVVVDRRQPESNPFREPAIVIASYQYAARRAAWLTEVSWDLIVIDEAHRLRNAWKSESMLGRPLLAAIEHAPKLLLTATPLQNSLLELYGLVSVIDSKTFGEVSAFRSGFMKGTPDYDELRLRLKPVVHRTLRKAVLPYIRYTARRSLTWKFKSSPAERTLYNAVSDFLARPDLISLPLQQRALISMVLRKLLASSARAIAGGLEKLRSRLEDLKEAAREPAEDLASDLGEESFNEEWLDELTDMPLEAAEGAATTWTVAQEIAELDRLLTLARGIDTDRRAVALLDALRAGFEKMHALGAPQKAVIFTEFRRTQAWLKGFLDANGYAGKIVCFNGDNRDPEARAIFDAWEKRHSLGSALRATAQGGPHAGGSRTANLRAALVEHFRDTGTIFLATEAGAEGLNLQFASLVVNYDLPWNPQRVEQRIGRCHRYGQRHDVVVVNFLDEANQADCRVLELLTDKCQLFDGVFGASDEILGSVEGGAGLEVKIHRIFRTCRTPAAIEQAFAALRAEMDETIRAREATARQALLDHFDADVHDRLKIRLDEARVRLDRIGRQFWALTRWALADVADFEAVGYHFTLHHAPRPGIATGRYELVARGVTPGAQALGEAQTYRLSHPLGEVVIEAGRNAATPLQRVVFDVTHHPLKMSLIQPLRGRSGWLTLEHMHVTGLNEEEHLLLSGCVDGGTDLDPETLDQLFSVGGRLDGNAPGDPPTARLDAAARRLREATLNKAGERNQTEFRHTRERLERWADDAIRGAEAAITEVRVELRTMERRARQTETLEDQREIQRQIADIEARQRKARQRVFNIEDEVREKRRLLLDELDRRVAQHSRFETVFRIAWTVE